MEKQSTLNTEDDIEKLKRKDDYTINKVAKYGGLFLMLILGVVIVTGFSLQFFMNAEFQKSILEIMKSNMSGIVIAALYIFGIDVLRKKEK